MSFHLMPAYHRTTSPAKVFGQISLHLRGGFIRHWVQMCVQLRQQSKPIAFDQQRAFDSLFVIRKTLLRCQARHPDIDARLCRVAIGIGQSHLAEFAYGFV